MTTATDNLETIREAARNLRGELVRLEIRARQLADADIDAGRDEEDAETIRAALGEAAWALEAEGC